MLKHVSALFLMLYVYNTGYVNSNTQRLKQNITRRILRLKLYILKN